MFYASNSSGLKIYQTNFIQCIKFKDVSSLSNNSDNNNMNSMKKNTPSKSHLKGNNSIFNYTEENKNLEDIEKIEEELINNLNNTNKS